MAAAHLSNSLHFQGPRPLHMEISKLSQKRVDDQTIDRVIGIREKAIQTGIAVYDQDLGGGCYLTVIPARFAILTLNKFLGQGDHKVAEEVIQIDAAGRVSLAAEHIPRGNVSDNLRRGFENHLKVDGCSHVARAGECYTVPAASKTNYLRIAFIVLGSLLLVAAVLVLLKFLPITIHLAIILAIVFASSGVCSLGGAVFGGKSNSVQERVIQPLYHQTFRGFIKKEKREEDFEKRYLGVLIQASEGLCEIHRKKLLHSDVNENNLLIGADGKAYWNDFGNARNIGPELENKPWLDIQFFGAMIQNSLNDVQSDISPQFLERLLTVTNRFGKDIETAEAAKELLQSLNTSSGS